MSYVPASLPRFAQAQTLSDLRALASTAPAVAAGRIAAFLPDRRLGPEADTALRTGRIVAAEGAYLRVALFLAATLPKDSGSAFLPATALLLADGLTGGPGADDMAALYDAHARAYRAAPPAVRAALMAGFWWLHETGLAPLDAPPGPSDRRSQARETVLAALATAPPHQARPLSEALTGGPIAPSEALWRARAESLVAAPALTDAVRHIYETHSDWDPYRDLSDAEFAAQAVVIPFEAA